MGALQDLEVGVAILIFDSKDEAKCSLMKTFQLLNVPVVECPGLAVIEKRGQDHSIVQTQLCHEPNDVLTE